MIGWNIRVPLTLRHGAYRALRPYCHGQFSVDHKQSVIMTGGRLAARRL